MEPIRQNDGGLRPLEQNSADGWTKAFSQELWKASEEKNPEKAALAKNQLQVLGRFLSEKLDKDELKRTISDSCSEYVFHGTPKDFAQVLPQPNTRTDSDGHVIWSGNGVFASPDRRIAIVYTNQHVPGYGQGVDLVDKTSPDQALTLVLFGGKSKEDALDKLYGTAANSKGYIHMLDNKGFSRESGLGQMEVVSRDIPSYHKSLEFPNGIQVVNPRKEIETYVEEGKMEVLWRPQ